MHVRKRSYDDWKYASLPTTTPIPSRTRSPVRWIFLLLTIIFLFFCTISMFSVRPNSSQSLSSSPSTQLCVNFPFNQSSAAITNYDASYPLTSPFKSRSFVRYKIALIADLDKKSKSYGKDVWVSFLLEGELLYFPARNTISVRFDPARSMLKGTMTARKRGMELSELTTFNGRLYTCDDRTGLIYELRRKQTGEQSSPGSTSTSNETQATESIVEDSFDLIPWVILMDGDGHTTKPFKCEWLAVQNQHLFAGGLGKEWTTSTGEFINNHPQWVKRISVTGSVEHLNWTDNYNKLAAGVGIKSPGYIIHESAVWSDRHNRWFFLPRKASKEIYDEDADESRSTNLLIETDRYFENVTFKSVGQLNLLHGFSSFKFLPQTDDEIIVAIKSMEYKETVSTFITAFKLDGTILLPEQLVDANFKFEGIEFV